MPSDQFRAAIGIKGIRILHTQLSQGERHETRRVGPYAMPWDQHIKGGRGAREPGVEKRPAPVYDFLDVTDQRPPREDRLHQPAVLPLTALTPCEVGGSPWRVPPGRRRQC
jgi:hypothetical protein